MLIALKYNEDDYFANEFYAKVGGVAKKEIDKLEYEFLIRSEYKLYVSEDVFEKYNNYQPFIQRKIFKKSGSF